MKVGDYVRTKYGRIGKIYNLTVDYSSELILCEESSIPFAKHQIIKSSPNIIDLIEVGDYVNGVRVDEIISKDDKEICFRYKYSLDKDDVYTLLKEDVKSILTKEQFEAMEYRIGE